VSTHWHPLFGHLLGLGIHDYYEIQPEVPVSDLPRRGDFFLVRRQGVAPPPFVGLWSHLTEWNLFEFKGPSDDAEEADLELLMHIGTGLTYRFNEERQARKEQPLGPRQVSFWYLAPRLGETFLGHARLRTFFQYETGGLWRATCWGHPIWLLAYRDAPVEEDTIPLRLLDRDPPAPRALGELVLRKPQLLQAFAPWFSLLQPTLWEEIRIMATTSTEKPIIDWEAVGKYTNLEDMVRAMPPDLAARLLAGVVPPEKVVQILAGKVPAERMIQMLAGTLPPERIAEVISLSDPAGAEKVLEGLLKHFSAEQLQELLRRKQG
jgi:hypothetical protein